MYDEKMDTYLQFLKQIDILQTFVEMRAASAKDQAENQFGGKKYIGLTLLLSFPFQENLITSLHLSTNEEILTSHIQQIIDRLSV